MPRVHETLVVLFHGRDRCCACLPWEVEGEEIWSCAALGSLVRPGDNGALQPPDFMDALVRRVIISILRKKGTASCPNAMA